MSSRLDENSPEVDLPERVGFLKGMRFYARGQGMLPAFRLPEERPESLHAWGNAQEWDWDETCPNNLHSLGTSGTYLRIGRVEGDYVMVSSSGWHSSVLFCVKIEDLQNSHYVLDERSGAPLSVERAQEWLDPEVEEFQHRKGDDVRQMMLDALQVTEGADK
jgi:hypothetical protein